MYQPDWQLRLLNACRKDPNLWDTLDANTVEALSDYQRDAGLSGDEMCDKRVFDKDIVF